MKYLEVTVLSLLNVVNCSERTPPLSLFLFLSICSEMQNAEFEGSTQAGSMKTLKLRELTQQRETELGKTALTMVREWRGAETGPCLLSNTKKVLSGHRISECQ
jgi:hypothetical protein